MLRRRSLLFAILMAATMLGSSVAIATAHADKFIWRYKYATCYSDGMSARGVAIEQGTTGTTWMKVTARFQRLRNGYWKTTQSDAVQSSQQFANNHNDHKLAATFAFVNAGPDYTYLTRISFKYEWLRNNSRIYKKVLATGRC
jgi:hypothetical protein